jgi:hypothetical protein
VIYFIAHDLWSAVWVGLLSISGIVTISGNKKEARRILYVLCLNWLATRSIVSLWPSSDLLWLLNDFVTVIAFILYGRTVPAKACALLFFIIAQFDIAMIIGLAQFSPVAAISDLLGYIILIIMVGAAHDLDGRRITSHLGFSYRFFHRVFNIQARRSILPRASMPSRNFSENNNITTSNGITNER